MPDESPSQTSALVHIPKRLSLCNPFGYALEKFWDIMLTVDGEETPLSVRKRFSKREIASMEAIAYNFMWCEDRVYKLTKMKCEGEPPKRHKPPRHTGYMFHLPLKDIKNHPATTKMILAHEIKHASLRYSDEMGHFNIVSVRNVFHDAKNILLKDKYNLDDKIAKDKTKIHETKTLSENIKSRIQLGTHSAAKAANLFARMFVTAVDGCLSRFEERLCDDFAVRAAPEENLDDFDIFFKDTEMRESFTTTGEPSPDEPLPEFLENRLVALFAKNFCRTHPLHEERIATMRKKQHKILKNG